MALTFFALKDNEIDYKKTCIAAKFVGVDVELPLASEIPAWLTSYNKTNPIGELPALQTPDGPISGSNPILRYVTRLNAGNPLESSSLYEYGLTEQWITISSSQILPKIQACLQPGIGCADLLCSAEAAESIALKRALGVLNMYLASKTYLVGDFVTLADIVLTCDLYLGFTQLMPESFTSEFPHVETYFWTLVNLPNFKTILGEVEQTESLQYENMAQTIFRRIAAPFFPPTEGYLTAQP